MVRVAALPAPTRPLAFDAIGPQWLAVTGKIPERYLITYRAPASRLRALVPAPLEVDARDGEGFVSVCAVEIREMGVVHTPRWMRFGNVELLYRVSAKLHGEPTFVTLRSDVSAPALAILGRFFSHYRPRLGALSLSRAGGTFAIECRSRDGAGDASVRVEKHGDPPPGSVFRDARDAGAFLLGMRFSAGVRASGRVQVQEIDHGPWEPRFTSLRAARFDFLERLGVPLVHDSTLVMEDVDQVWRATRCRT